MFSINYVYLNTIFSILEHIDVQLDQILGNPID